MKIDHMLAAAIGICIVAMAFSIFCLLVFTAIAWPVSGWALLALTTIIVVGYVVGRTFLWMFPDFQ
jgi:hypothetical protein